MPDAPLELEFRPLPYPAEYGEERFESLPDQLRRHAAQRPDALAIREIGAPERAWTWAQAAARMDAGAALLRRERLQTGEVVAILANAPAEYTLAYLAGLAAGGCVAPLPAMAADETLAKMLEDGPARAIVVSEAMRERAETILRSSEHLAGMRRYALDFEHEDWTPLLDPALPTPEPWDLPEIEPGNLFNIIYSSGTTGVPKGIVHDHRFRVRQLPRLVAQGIEAGGRMILSTPLYSNTTLVAVFAALSAGCSLAYQRKYDGPQWLETVEAERITNTMLVPVLINRLLALDEFDRRDLSSLKLTTITSSPLAAATKRDMIARWPGKIVEIYGLTEGGVSTSLDLKAFPDKAGSVGRPGPGAELLILDEAGRPLPQGETGEIAGRSPTQMRGYHGRPDLTRESLVRLPDGGVAFRSGDLGRVDEDGFLWIMGRRKDVIISGGFNIYATDLEEALFAHPAVKEAGVVGAPSAEWGETPVAGVVLREGAEASPQELLDFANARLGRNQRLAAVHVLDALPRNAVGKVVKPDLLERLRAL